MKLDLAYFKDRFNYDPEEGIFTSKGFGCGSVAYQGKHGVKLIVDRVNHPAHRVAWLWVHGEYPDAAITHLDSDPYNNKISNLIVLKPKKDLTIDELKQFLNYDPETGDITWAMRMGRMQKGDLAGVEVNNGHRQITILGKPYRTSRLAWALYYGEFPPSRVFTVDGNPNNTAISNLSVQAVPVFGKVITQARLKELLDYDPETGIFIWKQRTSNRVTPGDEAGRKDKHGHIGIRIDTKNYRAHRLAWLWVYGRLPDNDLQIDHINGVPDDNRIENLRECTAFINQQNRRRAAKNNSTGVLGVHKAPNGRLRVRMRVAGKEKGFGRFNEDQLEEAQQLALEMKRKHHEGCTI